MRRISSYASLEVPVGGRVERSLQVRLDLTVVCDEVADRLGLDTAIHTYIHHYEATSQDRFEDSLLNVAQCWKQLMYP